MAEGTNTYQGMAVPLLPADGFEIKQQTASSAVDIMTLTLASSGTGDPIVIQNSSGTELLVINADGDIAAITNFDDDINMTSGEHIVLNKTDQTTYSRLRLPILSTAPASASLTKGDLWLAKATTDVYRIALCISTAGAATRYGLRMHLQTIGAST